MAHWGIWGICLMYVLEGMAAPWPIEVPLWLTGDMLHHGQAGYWELVFVTWLGASLGNLIAFVVARLGGRSLLIALTNRFHLQKQVDRVQGWVRRFGLATVVFTRWTNWGFGLALWLMGFSDVSPYVVIPTMLINTAIWACAWVAFANLVVGGLVRAGLPGWFTLVPGAAVLAVMGIWQLVRRMFAQKVT
jgi:membrane protein DedA with SNARE-associated domain